MRKGKVMKREPWPDLPAIARTMPTCRPRRTTPSRSTKSSASVTRRVYASPSSFPRPAVYPTVVMAQYSRPTWAEDEYERAGQRGWFDRLAEEVDTDEDSTERWI